MNSQITFLDTGIVCAVRHVNGIYRVTVYNNGRDAELSRYDKFKQKIENLCNQ